MLNVIKKFFINVKSGFFKSLESQRIIFRLVEINSQTQEIVFHVIGKNITFKSTFAEAANDTDLIQGLSPEQACCLGLYYGRILRASLEGREVLRKAKNFSYLLQNDHGRYKIISENRNGEIGYTDTVKKKIFMEHPLAIIQSNFVVSQFGSTHICYIGILAGMMIEKTAFRDKKTGKDDVLKLFKIKPTLRIIN